MTDLDSLWESSWASSLAESQQRTETPIELWRTAGRKTKDKPNGEDLGWWHDAGRDQLKMYKDWLDESGWMIASFDGKAMIEYEVNASFNGGVTPVKGFIDACMVNPAGQLIIVDYKSGSRAPASVHQLALYATMMGMVGLPTPTLGAWYMTREGKLGAVEDLTRYDKRFFDRLFKQLNTAVQMNVHLPSVGDHCKSCSVNDFCYAYGGEKSAQFDPDDPNCTLPEF